MKIIKPKKKRAGVVVLIGRTNAGKSTLLNSLLKQKVTITSPKPKTTRFSIRAVYEDDEGQIVFVDTPGQTKEVLGEKVDLVVYLIDQTRKRGSEENVTFGIVRKFENVPKILVYNKIDVKGKDYRPHYKFLETEVDDVLEVSALKGTHLKSLISAIYKHLPERDNIVETEGMATPLLNVDSNTFISEIIREKVYLFTGQEVPYQTSVVVDEVTERDNGSLYIRARVLTLNERYRKMLIGSGGRKIKEIGMNARKELALASDKKVFLELTVEVS